MKNLFEAATADEIKARLRQLRADSPRLWGKMTAAQMVEHCARSMEWAVGDTVPQKVPLIMRIFGRIVKPLVLRGEKRLRPNSPTGVDLLVTDEPEFYAARARLFALVDRFVAGGSAGCTTHPHGFFGKMTPEEWGVLTYKHMDHHLRQFGV